MNELKLVIDVYSDVYTYSYTRNSVLGTRNSVLGTRNSVLGTQYWELGTRYSKLGTRYSVLGTRYSELGTRNSDLGTRNSELGTGNSVLGTRYSVLGTWYSELSLFRVIKHIMWGCFNSDMNRITAAMYARYSECGTRNAVLETSYEIRTSRFQVKRNVVYKNILTQSVYHFLIDQF